MTRDELIFKINEEINHLEQQKENKNSLLQFFTNFTSKYKGIAISDFDTINLYDFAVAFFLDKKAGFTLEETKEILLPIKQLISIVDPGDIASLFDSILTIVHLNEIDLLKAVVSDSDVSNVKTKILHNEKMFKYIENALIEIEAIINSNNLDRTMIIELAELIRKYGYEIWDIKKIIGNIKLISDFEIMIQLPNVANDIEYKERITSKIQKNIQFIYDKLNSIFNYTEKLERKETARIAKIDKKEKPLKEFLIDFEMSKDTEITNFQEMIEKIPENLRLDALKLIYLHNEKIYANIDREYVKLDSNKKLKYQKLLNTYDINYISQLLLQIPYENLNKSLHLLKKFGLDNNVIIYILENSSLRIIEEINFYLERGIINKKFIKNNYLILLPNIENTNLSNNIKLLEKENINPNSFIASARILLIDNTLFSTNIEVLKKYNLLSSMKTTTNYNFLQDSNMINIIDKLLELGMEKFLEENIGLLNNKNIDRLYILKTLNIKINTMDELMAYLSLKNFYVNDEDIFKYLHEGTIPITEDEGTIDLNNFQSTDRTINIGGILFSKNKVQRNLKSASLKDTKEALFKDIILSNEEIETVISALNDKKVYTYK